MTEWLTYGMAKSTEAHWLLLLLADPFGGLSWVIAKAFFFIITMFIMKKLFYCKTTTITTSYRTQNKQFKQALK